jgi:hypothetical protein
MKMITYDENDILPITIVTLNICLQFYIINAFKLVVDRECPDLKGLVSTDTIDESILDVFECVDNEWFDIMTDSMAAINNTLYSLANINGLDLQALVDDIRIDDLAQDLYDNIVIDVFLFDGEEPTDLQNLADDMTLYTFSLLGLVHCLFELTISRSYDEEIDWSDFWITQGFDLVKYEEQEHRITLNLLHNLWLQLNEDQCKLVELDF